MEDNKKDSLVKEWAFPTIATFVTLFTFIWVTNWYKYKATEKQKKNFKTCMSLTFILLCVFTIFSYAKTTIDTNYRNARYEKYINAQSTEEEKSAPYNHKLWMDDIDKYGRNSPQAIRDSDRYAAIVNYDLHRND